jgi:predicted nucleic acid-binding protein
MKYVLDASVAVKWVLAEVDSDKADALRDAFRSGIHDLIAPDVFPVEVGHAIAKAERRGIIDPPDGSLFLADVLTTIPHLRASLPLLSQAFSIASSERIGVYDCLYVALADQQQCELFTADERLVKLLQKQFPFILPLSALP